MTEVSHSRAYEQSRAGLFAMLLLVVNLVMDGLPRLASPFMMQLGTLPFTFLFVIGLCYFLAPEAFRASNASGRSWDWLQEGSLPRWSVVLWESCFALLFVYESRHFASFQYQQASFPIEAVLFFLVVATFLAAFRSPGVPAWIYLVTYLSVYVAGQILAIVNFPLTYLRSDMLPVISWAERALLGGGNPYQHFYVAERIYDFPYLPGTLLAFAPAQALHVDLRWCGIVYVVAGMSLIYGVTAPKSRMSVGVLIGLFVLCPYLQYRHELYTQPLFLSLILVFALLQQRLFAWSAAAFGLSLVISQFSWVIFPFFLLHALRRGGWKEAGRMIFIAGAISFLLFAPFLHWGSGNIAHNAVGQWDRLARPIARPMNLAFWASYLVRPNNLKWLQLVLLSAIFLFCWMRGRCADLADTLRWMIVALTTFIFFNVLVDGYFYLMLLIPMLVYTCVANGWWPLDQRQSVPATRLVESR